MSNLPVLLFIAVVVMCCSGHLVKDTRDLMKKSQCSWLGCHPTSLLSRKRLSRSPAEEQDKTVIYSDLPADRILQEVKSQYMSSNDEYAEIIQDENQEIDSLRHKRGVRAVVIRICHRRTGQCRIIIVYKRT